MSIKKTSYKIMKFAQSCDGKKCRSDHKDEIVKNFYEAIATPHEVDFTNKKITCLYCGKMSKL